MFRPRVLTLCLVAFAALLLVSCRPINPNFEASESAASGSAGATISAGSVGGNAAAFSGLAIFDTGEALPAAAQLQVEVIDVDGGFYPANVVGRTVVEVAGLRSPIPFLVTLDRNAVSPGGNYVLGARVFAGDELLLTSQESLTLGANVTTGLQGLELALSPMPDDPETPGVLAGTVSYRARVALPEGATVVVELVDRTSSPYSLVSRYMVGTQGEQPPLNFAVDYDPAQIDPRRTYALDARIVIENRVAFLLPEPEPVLTLGKPKDQVELVLEVADEAMVDRLSAVPFDVDEMGVEVAFPREQPLPEVAVLQLEVVNLNAADSADAVLALTEQPVGYLESPLVVSVPVEQEVDTDVAYLLVGRILIDGETAFEATGAPVLTQGAPVDNVQLQMQATGAEAVRQRELFAATLSGQIDGLLYAPEGALIDETSAALVILRQVTPGTDPELAPVVATADFTTDGMPPPFAFVLSYDPAEIDPAEVYQVDGALFAGGAVQWVTAEPLAVLTQDGIATGAEILLQDAAVVPARATLFAAAAEAAAVAEAAEEAAEDAAGAVVTEEYVVVEGDTLSTIAARFGVTVAEIQDLNDLEGDLIRVGDTLIISITLPEEPGAEEPGAEEPGAEESSEAAGETAAATQSAAETAGEAGVEQTITGTVSFRQRIALVEGALVEVQLIDVSSEPPAVVAQQLITTAGEQPPIPFTLTFTPTVGDDGRAYGLAARISYGGQARFVSAELTPARSAGAWRTNVPLMLAAVPTSNSGGVAASSAAQPQAEAELDLAAAGAVTGEVNLNADLILPGGALVTVQLAESAPDGGEPVVIAEQSFIIGEDEPPFTFSLEYGADTINAASEYAVTLEISDGGNLLGASGEPTPVLTGGAPNEVQIDVGP